MLVVIGETLIDEVVHSDGSVAAHPGGSPMNVAVGLARLGEPTSFIGRWGKDAYGADISGYLQDNSVVVPLPAEADAPATSVARAQLASDGAATYTFELDWDLTDLQAQLSEVFEGATLVHTGSIAAMLVPGADQVYAALVQARTDSTISYDPNFRPTIITDVDQARGIAEKFVALADIVKASDEDLEHLYAGRSIEESAKAWLAMGTALVVVTRGSQGSLAVFPNGSLTIPAPQVEVSDTVGAGDSFMSALLAGVVRRGLDGAQNRGELREISQETVRELLSESARAAAITVSRKGANPPTSNDLGWTK